MRAREWVQEVAQPIAPPDEVKRFAIGGVRDAQRFLEARLEPGSRVNAVVTPAMVSGSSGRLSIRRPMKLATRK